MNWLRKILGMQTPEEALLSQLGIDPHYRDKKVVCDGLTFKRISISEMEANLSLQDDRIVGRDFTILLSGVDHVSESHRELLQKIRGSLQSLFGQAVEAVLGAAPPDEQDFRAYAKDASIMIGENDGDFDGRSWSMVFSWGEGDFGYHVEFKDMEIVDVWGGDNQDGQQVASCNPLPAAVFAKFYRNMNPNPVVVFRPSW